MLSYYLKCRKKKKKTEIEKLGKQMLLSKRMMRHSKKVKYIKKQEPNGLSLRKISVLGNILF